LARTRAQDFEEKQRGILDVAARVFAEQGMEKASMSRIAGHAGVSKGLLYHYYPSKSALIFAIVQAHLEELDKATAAADARDLPPGQRLRRLVGAVLENYRGADDKHKVQLNAAPALSEDQRIALTSLERRIVQRFSVVLDEVNPGLNKPERPLSMPVTMSLFGMLNWMYMWFRDGGRITREDYAEIVTTLVLEGVRAVR
jgi:AcrR family transcriptional regulator